MRTTVMAPELADRVPFDYRTYLNSADAELTDEHPSSSYGLPVLVHQGQVYGPADVPDRLGYDYQLVAYHDISDVLVLTAAARCGWRIRPVDGDELLPS